jgi:hypothetical protein
MLLIKAVVVEEVALLITAALQVLRVDLVLL